MVFEFGSVFGKGLFCMCRPFVINIFIFSYDDTHPGSTCPPPTSSTDVVVLRRLSAVHVMEQASRGRGTEIDRSIASAAPGSIPLTGASCSEVGVKGFPYLVHVLG